MGPVDRRPSYTSPLASVLIIAVSPCFVLEETGLLMGDRAGEWQSKDQGQGFLPTLDKPFPVDKHPLEDGWGNYRFSDLTHFSGDILGLE